MRQILLKCCMHVRRIAPKTQIIWAHSTYCLENASFRKRPNSESPNRKCCTWPISIQNNIIFWIVVEYYCVHINISHIPLLLSQALSTTCQGLSPSSRQDTRVNVRELSWRWSASFTRPGISKSTTSVTADGWETAVYGFPSATPGNTVAASLKRGCAHLDSPKRRRICTVPIATGSPKQKQLTSVSQQSWGSEQNAWVAQNPLHSIHSLIHQRIVLNKKPPIWSRRQLLTGEL